MLNKIVLISSLLTASLFAQATADSTLTQSPTEKAAEDQVQAPEKQMKTIEDLDTHLVESFKKAGLDKKATIAYCSDVRALYSVAKPIISQDPTSMQALEVFALCSLTTESAVANFNNQAKKMQIMALQDSIIATLNATKNTMSAISETEKSHTSQRMAGLEADLAKEKADAEKLRAAADKKFSELQSSLIQVSNDARGTIISMSDILFAVGKADLTPDLRTSLAKISGILMVFKTSRVVIEGHTDNSGSEEFNLNLSKMRAENVRSFMIEQGVSGNRLKAVGFGFAHPMADNETEEGRAKNRRVDLVIQERK